MTEPLSLSGVSAANAQASRKPARWLRLRTMLRVGKKMMFYDKLKLAGTLFGVIFAVVLTNQQLGVFLGLLSKNTMFIDNAGANLWIVPESTQTLQAGKPVAMSVLYEARTTPGVAWAEPLLFGGATVSLPKGGSEPITLVGTKAPCCRGGPWNMVAGSADALRRPDTMIFEDSERDKLGGLNLGSVREVNRHRTVVGGFTWGLLPFGPSYAFADYDYARVLMGTPSDETSFVLVGLAPGADRAAVTRALQARVTGDEVLSTEEFHNKVLKYLLVSTGIGATTGTSTAFGLLVGLIIVSLSMFSSVIDNIREFGTLKAIGCRNRDLALMLLVQSSVYALLGSMIGLGMISAMAEGIRSPKLALVLPWAAYATTPLAMVLLCGLASLLALSRIRKVEPAMVFR
jgi:putative ABC transport system permease protein